jgi:arginine/lysine/ornithine decarboxylase
VKLASFSMNQHLLFDPTKLILTVDGLTGSEVWDVLLERYGILVEKVTKRAVVITMHSHTEDEDA